MSKRKKGRIRYRLAKDNFKLITPCPHGKKTDLGISIMVGSGFCHECPEFIEDDYKKHVTCRLTEKAT
jgi:hypothetical protein